MNTRLIAMLGVALAMVACGSTTSDTSGPASSEDAAVSGAVAVDSTPELAEASQGPEAGAPAGPTSGEPSATPSTASSEPSMAPNSGSFLPEYEEMVLPNGTELLMSLTTSIGSDTSEVEDAVSADLTQAIAVDGREVLPAGAQVVGRVTGVDGGGRVSGRATIEFRFVSIRVGDEQATPELLGRADAGQGLQRAIDVVERAGSAQHLRGRHDLGRRGRLRPRCHDVHGRRVLGISGQR